MTNDKNDGKKGVDLRKDNRLQKMLQMMLLQLLWLRVKLWHLILEGKGAHPSTNLAGEVSKMQINAGEVLEMQNSSLSWQETRAR